MIRPADALDVQMALARLTKLRVATRRMTATEVEYVIGFKWLFALDEDDLDSLARETDSPHQFKESYDALKHSCLRFAEILSER